MKVLRSLHSFRLPYAGLLDDLVTSVFKGLTEVCENDPDSISDSKLNAHFVWLARGERGVNPHLFLSNEPDRSLRSEAPIVEHSTRISALIRSAFQRSRISSTSGSRALLPSPLHILQDYLTVPQEPASQAYAFLTLRTYLFRLMKVCPTGQSYPSNYLRFTYREIEDTIGTIKTHVDGRDNIPLSVLAARNLVCHLLAMKGLLHLRFGTLRNKTQVDPIESRLAYCRNALVAPSDGYEFRAAEDIAKLPEVGEMINELWGLPLPIRGADTVFFGGLKFSSEGGLVGSITGAPGSGKTSVALALAVALSALGSVTYFLTAEEAPEDLNARLATLTPTYLSQLSIFSAQQDKWFHSDRVTLTGDHARSYLKKIISDIEDAIQSQDATTEQELPLPCPLVVILDGLQNFFLSSGDKDVYSIHDLVADCRKLGALVVFTSPLESETLGDLDYLADLVLRLEYRHTNSVEDRPVRIFLLRKTRLQISRPGAHVCHLSGVEGFRISPQLPSQLDRRSIFKQGLPDQRGIIQLFNRPFLFEELARIRPDRMRIAPRSRHPVLDERSPGYLDIRRRSHILLHGRGSSGKSGLGLKLLLAPIFANESKLTFPPHRVLVVSFLYPLSYYAGLRDSLTRLFRYEYPELNRPIRRRLAIEVLHFLPGFLNPEDLVEKIESTLERGDLEGHPYDGVLLDGLHNVFLQFPRLAKNSMVWPMLYGLLRTRTLTVVSTHTTFNITSSAGSAKDTEFVFDEARPLLHALVQAADYYIELETPSAPALRGSKEDFQITIVASITPAIPTEPRYWNREKLVLHTGMRQPPLPLKLDDRA